MQPKFTSQTSARQSFVRGLLKILLLLIIFTFAIFIIEKINFPHPNKEIKKDITNETIKLK
jgi:flagellar biogenesis protein FliO